MEVLLNHAFPLRISGLRVSFKTSRRGTLANELCIFSSRVNDQWIQLGIAAYRFGIDVRAGNERAFVRQTRRQGEARDLLPSELSEIHIGLNPICTQRRLLKWTQLRGYDLLYQELSAEGEHSELQTKSAGLLSLRWAFRSRYNGVLGRLQTATGIFMSDFLFSAGDAEEATLDQAADDSNAFEMHSSGIEIFWARQIQEP